MPQTKEFTMEVVERAHLRKSVTQSLGTTSSAARTPFSISIPQTGDQQPSQGSQSLHSEDPTRASA